MGRLKTVTATFKMNSDRFRCLTDQEYFLSNGVKHGILFYSNLMTSRLKRLFIAHCMILDLFIACDCTSRAFEMI